MITLAEPQDKEAIYQIWKELFADDDGGYTDYYFESLYAQAITYVIKEDGQIKAVLQRQKHEIRFHQHIVPTSMILGVATLPEYQGQGFMKKLMKYALDDANKEEMVTMIQAYHPDLYTPFGFRVYYHTKTIPFTSTNRRVTGRLGHPDFSACLNLYDRAMALYEGTIVRTEQSFLALFEELKAQGGQLIGYFEGDVMKAYAALECQGDNLVTECFGDCAACVNLLTLAEREYGSLKQQICDRDGDPYTMLLFHDWARFASLTAIEESSESAYFQNLDTLLYMHENA